MDDLVAQVNLVDRELMNKIRERLGSTASIDTVLDTARDVIMRRYAQQVVRGKCETVFAMVEYIHDFFELNVEDTRIVLGHVRALTGDAHLGRFLEADLIEHVWNYTRLDPVAPRGCFTWARNLRPGRPCRIRRPCRLNCPSPGTGTAGTDQ